MIYFDSTYIIKCYLAEPGSAQVLALAQAHPGRACAVHGRLEFFSGIKRHVREGNLSHARADAVLRQFLRDETSQLWLFLTVDRSLIEQTCTRLMAVPTNVLCRAADALHIVCAAENGFDTIYSNDRHLLTAAPHFGMSGVNVIT
ncbi:MAG: type II toxin-antitoxin system VapC family toxin [Verrucomicrobiales bacterium]